MEFFMEHPIAIIMGFDTVKKAAWYRIGLIDYSTDIQFLLDNQISAVANNLGEIIFHSRLEKRRFDCWTHRNIQCLIGDVDIAIMNNCKEIHRRLLNGDFGMGEFIN